MDAYGYYKLDTLHRLLIADCYTCPLKDLIANGYKADAGHYKPVALVGSNNQLSWDEHFIHLQCSRCNGSGQGMAVEYRAHLVRDYGEDLVAKFDATWRQVNPVKNWKAIIEAPPVPFNSHVAP